MKGGAARQGPGGRAAGSEAALARNGPIVRGGVCPLRPGSSDINLFRYCERVVDPDPEVSYRALDLGMTQ